MTLSLRYGFGAVDDIPGRSVDALEQRLDCFAADMLDLDAHLLGILQEARVLERALEGCAQRREPVSRHAGRRKERPAHFLRRKEKLEHLAVFRRLGLVDERRYVRQLGMLLERHLEQDVDFLV